MPTSIQAHVVNSVGGKFGTNKAINIIFKTSVTHFHCKESVHHPFKIRVNHFLFKKKKFFKQILTLSPPLNFPRPCSIGPHHILQLKIPFSLTPSILFDTHATYGYTVLLSLSDFQVLKAKASKLPQLKGFRNLRNCGRIIHICPQFSAISQIVTKPQPTVKVY